MANSFDTEIPEESRRIVAERDDQRCVRCHVRCAQGELHHRRTRSRHDEHTHCPCNLIWMCRTCHGWVHGNPNDAIEGGFITSRHHELPSKRTIEHIDYGPVLLDCLGDFILTIDKKEQPS